MLRSTIVVLTDLCCIEDPIDGLYFENDVDA